jgi:hypothetical protein
MTTANSVARVIAAEATSGTTAERIADMRAIASVIANRAQQLGVSQYDVIANQVQFNAFGNRMPAGTNSLVDMAQEAIDYVAENGPTTNATFYATPERVGGLPGGLNYETETTGHQFYSDPQYRSIDTAVGSIMPNQYAFAQNPQNVPVPGSADDASLTANVDPSSGLSTNWGLNPDVAPVPVPTFNQWEAMANAKPMQAPVAAPTKGLFAQPADLSGFAAGMDAQRLTNIARPSVAPISGFIDPAAAGPFGGDFAAPADRFAGTVPSQSQPFDRYVQTTSIPTAVDPNSYQPGTAPMVDTSAAPTNRVQSISITPDKGLFSAAPQGQPITQADVDRAMFNVTGDGAFDPAFAQSLASSAVAPNAVQSVSIKPGQMAAPITQADIDRALFDPSGNVPMEPGLSEAMMSPQYAVAPMAVETTSITPGTEIASSRFSTPAKTSRIVPTETLTDTARINPLTGTIDPSKNTQSFTDQPADIGGFLEASAAQRGPQKGIFSAEAQAQQGHVYNESLKAEAARQAAMVAANPALATPNFAQAVNPTVPGLTSFEVDPNIAQMTEITQASQVPGTYAASRLPSITEPAPAIAANTATPQQQVAGYQQMASSAANADLLNLSGSNLYDVNLSGKVVPTSPYTPTNTLTDEESAPALETVEIADQPTISKTQTEIPGPATETITAPQEQQQTTTSARMTPQSTTAKRGFWDSVVSPQTAIGATVGGLALGPVGGLFGALAGQQIAQNPGMFSGEPMQINNIGSGYENVTSIWSGGQPPGTQATASDGQTVTSMPGGMVAITNASGVTTTFDKNGKASSYFGNDLDQNQDQTASTASTNSGGFFGGLFG